VEGISIILAVVVEIGAADAAVGFEAAGAAWQDESMNIARHAMQTRIVMRLKGD
jgi:hypothetical protein